MLGPRDDAGKVKLMVRSKMTGNETKIPSRFAVRVASASKRKLAVSDQFLTETLILRPPAEKESLSILVNGQGPAMQETRASWNSLPSPASSVAPPTAAFHFPSGEQGEWRGHGVSPTLTTSNTFDALPTFSVISVLPAYRTRTSATKLTG